MQYLAWRLRRLATQTQSSPFRLKAETLKCFSENSPVCELSSTTPLPCQPAARPIPPPICLSFSGFGKNVFHRAIDKQNSRWASTSQPPSHLSKDFSLQAFYRSRTYLPLLFVLSPAIAVNHWTGDYSLVCITLCSDTGVRVATVVYECFFFFLL